jgi:hypothetical protein
VVLGSLAVRCTADFVVDMIALAEALRCRADSVVDMIGLASMTGKAPVVRYSSHMWTEDADTDLMAPVPVGRCRSSLRLS